VKERGSSAAWKRKYLVLPRPLPAWPRCSRRGFPNLQRRTSEPSGAGLLTRRCRLLWGLLAAANGSLDVKALRGVLGRRGYGYCMLNWLIQRKRRSVDDPCDGGGEVGVGIDAVGLAGLDQRSNHSPISAPPSKPHVARSSIAVTKIAGYRPLQSWPRRLNSRMVSPSRRSWSL
jgi:hypothetical protein